MFKKSEQTKSKLFEAALGLIAKEGFDATTMRAIAKQCGVAPGAIYYYFDSKESLIAEYYRQSHVDHLKLLERDFSTLTTFEARLHRAVTSKIEVALPYKDMARALFRVAANPDSPLSPFSEQSKTLRLESLRIFEDVMNGASDRFHPDIKELLPSYLWLYQMGVILFWIYDGSENSKKTFELIDYTVPLIANTNQQLTSPLAAPFRKKIVQILKHFAPRLG